jgi:hypothetical protein
MKIELLYNYFMVSVFGLRELRKARKTRAEGRSDFARFFLTRATFPSIWIRPSKDGDHREIVLKNNNFLCQNFTLKNFHFKFPCLDGVTVQTDRFRPIRARVIYILFYKYTSCTQTIAKTTVMRNYLITVYFIKQSGI